MGMLEQNANNKTKTTTAARVPSDRFILGKSECYYEAAQYLTGKLGPADVRKLFNNEAMSLEETEGKSLKVMFRTGTEVKFTGFVTAGDASLELDLGDVDVVMQAVADGEIDKAITVDELVDLF